MTATLQFEPLIPSAVWLMLAIVGFALTVWYARGRPASVTQKVWLAAISLWTAGLVGVLIVLLNPVWLERALPPAGKPSLTILVDSSASMGVQEGSAKRTRFQDAADAARKLFERADSLFDVRLATFSGRTTPTDVAALLKTEPTGATTDIAGAIGEHLDADRPQGQAIALLSDGIDGSLDRSSDLFAAVRAARGMDAPIYTWTFGASANVRDLALDLESQQEIVFVDQQAPVVARVRQTGLALVKATVSLFAGKEEVQRQEALFDASGVANASFAVRKREVGVLQYSVKVAPHVGEATPVNNEATFLLRVVDKPLKVLVLEGKPYWDGKFLLRTLSADPSVALDSLVVMAPGRLLRRSVQHRKTPNAASETKSDLGVESWKIVNDPAEALSGPALDGYQIVVLGRNSDAFLSDAAFERLREWIARDSGSLVCYRGSPMARVQQQMSKLLPVKWEPSSEKRFRPRLTDRGRDARWLSPVGGRNDEGFATLPTLATTAIASPAGALSIVLAESSSDGEQRPVIAYQPYGAGRVVVIEGAGMWRWAFLPPQQKERDGAYAGLWRSLLRWLASNAGLAPGQKAALRADKVTFRTSEEATATLLVRESVSGAPPRVSLKGGGLDRPRIVSPVPSGDAPGVYRLPFGKLPEGVYRVGIEGDPSSETAFDVRRLTDEQLDLEPRPSLMARIASDSGGCTLDTSSGAELVKHFRGRRAAGSLERVTRTPAWDRWWTLIGVAALWTGAWRTRRAAGLA